MINEQIYITSLAKAVTNAKKTGKLNTKVVQTFNLFKYYIDFASQLQDNGSDLFDDIIISLKREASKFQYKYPDLICNYKVVIPNSPKGPGSTANTAPSVDDNIIDILEEELYQFSINDFTLNYSDAENHSYKYLLVYPHSTVNGELTTGNTGTTSFNVPLVFDIEGLTGTAKIKLFYDRLNLSSFTAETFTFRISDNPINYLYSAISDIDILSSVQSSSNQAPQDIGDNTLYVDNRAITIITLEMVTSGLTLPYNDPEGDLLDAIRIIDISNANTGVYTVNSVPIVENQIITREEIEAGLFVHTGPDEDSISSDVFQFQGRDEGSKIWVD